MNKINASGDILSERNKLESMVEKARKSVNKDKEDNIQYESKAKTIATEDEKNRGYLTYVFVIGFFLLISLSALFVLLYNAKAVDWIMELNKNGLGEIAKNVILLDLGSVLSVLIGAFGTSLGFIIGYYFKEKKG
ncbi:TPA: hypothetical protein ACRR3W_002460 [Providencia stuartii]|uniref:hypothetical protein n=1 Tax=Providencia stuartii TaxID=588 RepID=UPI0033858D36